MKKLAVVLLALVFGLGTAFAAGAQTSSSGTQSPGTQAAPGTSSPSSTGTTQANLSKKDMKFLKDTAEDGHFEVQASQMAAERATRPEVKDFAGKLANDHTQLSNDLSSLASNKGVTLPSSMDKKDRKELDRLGKLSGKKFDHEYLKEMIKNHKEDIRDFKSAAKDAKDPDVKSWAQNHISALEDHLKMAQDLEKKM